MKKIIVLLMIGVMCLSLFACNNESTKSANIESETFEMLDSAFDHCRTGITYMLRAWDFSIEHSSDNTREEYEAIWGEFSKHMTMTDDEIVDALINVYGVTLDDISLGNDASRGINKVINGMRFMKADCAIAVARYEFKQRNDNRDIASELEQIKENLQNIDNESEAYKLLKDYYLMVTEMKEWIESPSGSYITSKNNLIDYEKKSNSFKQELELIID